MIPERKIYKNPDDIKIQKYALDNKYFPQRKERGKERVYLDQNGVPHRVGRVPTVYGVDFVRITKPAVDFLE